MLAPLGVWGYIFFPFFPYSPSSHYCLVSSVFHLRFVSVSSAFRFRFAWSRKHLNCNGLTVPFLRRLPFRLRVGFETDRVHPAVYQGRPVGIGRNLLLLSEL